MFLQKSAKKPFPIFCSMLLSQNVSEFNEAKIAKWVKYYAYVFNNKEKVIKVNNIGDDYENFMSMYLFYLCLHENKNIIVVTGNNKSISAIRNIDSYFISIFRESNIKDDSEFHINKIDFTSGSKLLYLKASTYNIRNLSDINFIYFDKTKIKNQDKLLYDIEIFQQKVELEKMVLSIDNDLTKDFPELKIVEIK